MKFEDLGLSKKILLKVQKCRFIDPTEIQISSIPKILEGKDIIGLAETGSGKTAAYALPIIDKQNADASSERVIKTLVLSPTRELAMQIRNDFNTFASDTLRTNVIMGGVKESSQLHNIKKGTDILVATPGRLNDLIKRKKITLASVDTVVLDEADTMLDMGFIKDIKNILSKTKTKRQTIMFSATMSKEIMALTKEFQVDPITIKIAVNLENKPKIKEELYYVAKENKNDFIVEYLGKNRINQAIIFTRTKYGADKLCTYLRTYNLKCDSIHGDKRQGARLKALKDFKSGKISYLIATDIAARGIDIHDLPYVINYEVPEQAEVYIHRIGRTGRAGKEGIAISLVGKDELNRLKDVLKLIKRNIPIMESKYSFVPKDISNNKRRSHNNSPYKKNEHKYYKTHGMTNKKKNFSKKTSN